VKRLFLVLAYLCAFASASRAQSPSAYPYAKPYPNDPSTGTTQFTLTKLNTSGNAVIMSTSDLDGFIGVCVVNCGKTGTAWVAFAGLVPLTMDGTASAGDYVIPSTGTGGDGSDSSLATLPSFGAIGRVQAGCTGAACAAMVDVFPITAGSPAGLGVDPQSGTTYTINRTDRNKLVTENNASAVAVTLPQAGTSGFGSNFFHATRNLGAGLVTYTPTTSTINGASTEIIPKYWFAPIYSDNTNYYAPVMPTLEAFPSCSTAASALNFTTGTGLGCNTSITAAAMSFSGLSTGTNTIAAMTVGSGASIALAAGGVLNLGSGTPTTAFTLPTAGGAAPTSQGVMAYDSTANQTVVGDGTTTCGVGKHQVNAQSGAGYAVVNGDCGKLVTVSNASAETLTLPSSAPPKGWYIDAENTGMGTWTVSRNGLNIDGGTTNPTLTTNQGIRIFTDGTNYFTQRGVGGGGGGSGTVTSVAQTMPVQFAVANSPVTTSGTLADTYVNPNTNATIDPWTPFAQLPNQRRVVYAVANGLGSFGAIGDAPSSVAGTGGSTGNNTAPGASNPDQANSNTGVTTGTAAGFSTSTDFRTGQANGMMVQFQGSFSCCTTYRAAMGMSDQTYTTMVGSDTPAGNYAVFMASSTGTYTGLTDTTHIVCLTKNGTTQNAVSSGIVAANVGNHKYALWEDVSNSEWHFYIDNAEVCGTGITADIPSTSTNLRFVGAISNTTGTSSISFNLGWFYAVSNL
jgi:hypothetical protein